MHNYTYGKTTTKKKRRMKKGVGVLFILLGVITLGYFFLPLISYKLFLSPALANSTIESPLPKRYVMQGGGAALGELFASGISSVMTDFDDARNWFPGVNTASAAPLTESSQEVVAEPKKLSEYSFSFPSQEIFNAKVSIDDFDLSKHLVQYFSTSKNPIERGTSVIFGHSTLPQLFDPTNYKAIFAKMHTVRVGEEFSVTVEGKEYVYKIFAIDIMDSTDPNIFSQSFDNSYITIVTCTPPGTTWKRLVLRASLLGEKS